MSQYIVLLVDGQGNVVGIQTKSKSDIRSIFDTAIGGYGFGTTFGVGLESQRFQIAARIRESSVIDDATKDKLVQSYFTLLRVGDTTFFEEISAAQIRTVLLGDTPVPPNKLFPVFVDP